MNFDEAKAARQPAYCFLESGAVLRYDSEADQVRHLEYPAQPRAWQQAQFFHGQVPGDGWRHLAGCSCTAC
ncbi:MAG: hypothetical protein WCP98_20105 [Actinomycetes bacterium]